MSISSQKLLIVDDDQAFTNALANRLSRQGWECFIAHHSAAALDQSRHHDPDACLLDLRLEGENGLQLIAPLRASCPQMRLVLLTGYASIATAVEAIKRGADDYLAKPVGTAEVINVLSGKKKMSGYENPSPTSLQRLEWEHIQRILSEHGGNVSATAKALGLHRRTLQRKLAKKPKNSEFLQARYGLLKLLH